MEYSLTDSLGYIVNLTARAMRHTLRQKLQLAGVDLTAEQWGLLAWLQQKDGCKQMDLAHELEKDKTNIARIVDGLERRGLVERRQDSEDRRNNRIFLTPRGRETYEQLLPVVTSMLQQACAGMSPDQTRLLKKLLLQVHQNLSGENGG